MQPKLRNPLASWLLTVFTGGIYLLFWVWLIANELNAAENRTIFEVNIWRKIFLVLMILIFALFVFTATTSDYKLLALLLVMCLCLLILYIHIQLAFGRYIKSKDVELKTGKLYSDVTSILLFWFVGTLGVVYMQSAVNRIIRHERERTS